MASVVFIARVASQSIAAVENGDDGLLFYVNGDSGRAVTYAHGDPAPYTWGGMEIIGDGARGSGLRWPDYSGPTAFFAPGNIYAERGTLSFFWRPRAPLGKAPFKIFQVSCNDNSCMQMHWLRIDYNGSGLDAFVTDLNLAPVRVSWHPAVLPNAGEWTHIAFTWDETRGVRLYIDGALVAKKDATAVLSTGLGLFGTHGWKLNPLAVRSQYLDIRGGDYDELRIYESMLEPAQIQRLARGEPAGASPSRIRDVGASRTRDEWWLRYGWNRPGDIPPYLEAASTRVRKVEIHDAFDVKQWWWKACDGIRETTWPSVYNRSRIPDRDDYFELPDWNCYTLSGKAITFTLPDEPWNHLEITGAAFGKCDRIAFDHEGEAVAETRLFVRPAHQERTVHRFAAPYTGGFVRFTNDVQETPIGEFSAYYVTPGHAPAGTAQLTYYVDVNAEPDNRTLAPLVDYIAKRYLPDERQVVVALPRATSRPGLAGRRGRSASAGRREIPAGLPIVHVLIPADFRQERDQVQSYTWEAIDGGLDGIEVDLPALAVKPTHGDYFPMNIQVKDPLWPNRNSTSPSRSGRVRRGRSGSTPGTGFCRTAGAFISRWPARVRILMRGHSMGCASDSYSKTETRQRSSMRRTGLPRRKTKWHF